MHTTARNAYGTSFTRALEDEFNQIIRQTSGDRAGRERADAYLAHSHALYHGEPTPWAFTPKIFDKAMCELLKNAAETMGTIMDKITKAFRTDEAFRAQFGLDPEFARLCCLDTGYDQEIPLARVDIFLHEDTGAYQFCELNTDGSAGMVTTDEITHALTLTTAYQTFVQYHPNLRSFDISSSWVRAVCSLYASWEQDRTTQPHAEVDTPEQTSAIPNSLAIVDYAESIDREDVAHFVELFARRGVSARFVDVRDLRFERTASGQGQLMDSDGSISCVWRRAVTSELWEKPCSGREALIRAAEENATCIIGGFRTWPCATKTIFAVMWGDEASNILTPDEVAFIHEHVPYTEVLSPASDVSRFSDKDAWIVKPSGGYNARGVLAGLDADEQTWRTALATTAQEGGVIQHYAPQYWMPTMRGTLIEGAHRGAPAQTDVDGFAEATQMEGLYLFNGTFAGVYTRCGFANTIGEWTSRLNMACFVEDDTDGLPIPA